MTAGQLAKGMTFDNMAMMVPWLTKRIRGDHDVPGNGWRLCGIGANHAALDAILRCRHGRGLTRHRFTAEDIFVSYPPDG